MKVWRLEGLDGNGIYRSIDAISGLSAYGSVSKIYSDSVSYVHPCPTEYGQFGVKWTRERNKEIFRFGFPSIEQLYVWVHEYEWRKRLFESKFKISLKLYEVDADTTFVSPNQAAFIYEDAILIQEWSEGEWVEESFADNF